MYLRDLIPKGAMVTPRMPSYGVYQNVLLTDKRRGVFPAAVGPQGKLDMTGDTEKFVMLQGLSPCMYMPTDERGVTGMMKLMDKVIENAEKGMDWNYSEFDAKNERTAMLPESAWQDQNAFWVTKDANMIYGVLPILDFIWWLNKLQHDVEATRIPAIAEAKPIGLSVLFDQDNQFRMHRPKKTVNIRRTLQFEQYVPNEVLAMRLRRITAKWQCLVAAAAKQLAQYVKPRHDLKDSDYLAWAAYTIGAYAGFTDSIDDVARYTTEDVYQDTFSYLGLPFSDTWPDLSYDADSMKKSMGMYKHLFILNSCLSLAGKRIGGKMIPVQYLWRRGNIHVVKQMLKEYIRPPLEMGGSNNMWMHPALNTSVPYGVFFPSAMEEGNCEWEGNTTEKAEQFGDTMVDRGEISLSNLEEMNTNFRLVTSRDSRIRIVEEHGRQYMVIYNKILPDHSRNKEIKSLEEFLLSYISDPTLKFTGAVYLSASYMRPRFAFTLGPTPIVDTPLGKKIPIPGGLVDTDAGTVAALADRQAPQDAKAAAIRAGDAAETKNIVTPAAQLTVAETGVATSQEIEAPSPPVQAKKQ